MTNFVFKLRNDVRLCKVLYLLMKVSIENIQVVFCIAYFSFGKGLWRKFCKGRGENVYLELFEKYSMRE